MKKLKKLLSSRRLWMISLLVILGILYYMNKHVVITSYEIPYDEDLTIVHLSDIHHMKINDSIVKKIQSKTPDIIVITGDFIDRRFYDLESSLEWIDRLDYPIYYVTGNHEAWSGHADEVTSQLISRGVHVLRNDYESIGNFRIIGYDDPAFNSFEPLDIDGYKIVLYHRPESFDQFEADLILSGHAHGGQIRLFGKGLFSPGQGFMPEYTSGCHDLEDKKLIISRGLGNSLFPFRIFNQPEIVVIHIGK
ncbi:metallophosphoesterase [Acidaminobacter sp. JC074]|uniref:metallophosphoesterase n=1 Tax=Acidaminobacter sp. JC074 TaxID=2530199 RepID=UPI001F0F93CE|nr:metallophosphoesterase [Acidaminobacter sp. JC074]